MLLSKYLKLLLDPSYFFAFVLLICSAGSFPKIFKWLIFSNCVSKLSSQKTLLWTLMKFAWLNSVLLFIIVIIATGILLDYYFFFYFGYCSYHPVGWKLQEGKKVIFEGYLTFCYKASHWIVNQPQTFSTEMLRKCLGLKSFYICINFGLVIKGL